MTIEDIELYSQPMRRLTSYETGFILGGEVSFFGKSRD